MIHPITLKHYLQTGWVILFSVVVLWNNQSSVISYSACFMWLQLCQFI